MDNIDIFIKDNKLIFLRGHVMWPNYLGSSVTFKDNYVIYRNYTRDLKEFSKEITPYDFNKGSMIDFKDYLTLRIKNYLRFKDDNKAEISKLVALHNMRSVGYKFPHRWWEYQI